MLGAGFAGAASVASGLRLFAPSHRAGAPVPVKEQATE